MKRILTPVLIILVYICAMRLLSGFSCFWMHALSLPALRLLTRIGNSLSFPILECLFPVFILFCLFWIMKRRFFRNLFRALTVFAVIYLSIWYPLYFRESPVYTANTRQFSALCEDLIRQLNNTDLQFEEIHDLPAKFIHFPSWMDHLKISGLCSFATGEALITPHLSAVSIPFVAVHERMHLDGHAGEGSANIAAWKECLARGGVYADSARVYVLRCVMGMLKQSAPALYNLYLYRMDTSVLQCYREAGGAYLPAPLPPFQEWLFNLLGIAAPVQNYENIVLYLAAQFPQ